MSISFSSIQPNCCNGQTTPQDKTTFGSLGLGSLSPQNNTHPSLEEGQNRAFSPGAESEIGTLDMPHFQKPEKNLTAVPDSYAAIKSVDHPPATRLPMLDTLDTFKKQATGNNVAAGTGDSPVVQAAPDPQKKDDSNTDPPPQAEIAHHATNRALESFGNLFKGHV